MHLLRILLLLFVTAISAWAQAASSPVPAATPQTDTTQANSPTSRYRKAIADAISKTWYDLIAQKESLAEPGSIDVRFFITADGSMQDLRIISNTGNEALEACSIKAVTDAKLPPIPADIPPNHIVNGRYEVDFTFTLNPDDSDKTGETKK